MATSDNRWDEATAGRVSPADLPPDFWFENHLSVWLVQSLKDEAYSHLRENVGCEANWWGRALVVEPRYVVGLAQALREQGYRVRGN